MVRNPRDLYSSLLEWPENTISRLFRPGVFIQIAQLPQELVVRLSELQAVQTVARVRRELNRRDRRGLPCHGLHTPMRPYSAIEPMSLMSCQVAGCRNGLPFFTAARAWIRPGASSTPASGPVGESACPSRPGRPRTLPCPRSRDASPCGILPSPGRFPRTTDCGGCSRRSGSATSSPSSSQPQCGHGHQ